MNSRTLYRPWTLAVLGTLMVLCPQLAEAGSLSPVVTVPVVAILRDDSMAHAEVLRAVFVQVERRQDQDPLRIVLTRPPTMLEDDYQERLESAIANGLAMLDHEVKGLTVTIGFAGRFRFTGASFLGAIVIGTVAALEGRTLAPNLVLTATVESDGSLGPIGDLELKLAGGGAYTVLYPSSQVSNVPAHLTSALTSLPVHTLRDARAIMLP